MFFKDKESKVMDGLIVQVNAGQLALLTQMLSLMGNYGVGDGVSMLAKDQGGSHVRKSKVLW